MAVPAYNTDLTDITTAESTSGFSAYGGGSSGLSASPDMSMQGTNCVDKQITNADKGLYFSGSAVTLGGSPQDHVFIWHFCATPGLADSIAQKGASVMIGTGSTANCKYHIDGNDTYGAAGRVGKCHPIDYTLRSSNTGSRPYRTVQGSPGANPSLFGGGLNTTGSVKGPNMGIDAIRYGTGIYITAGDVSNKATFAGAATQSDAVGNRWGVLTEIGGGFELQGRFVVGQNTSGTATAAYFDDANVSLALVDTEHSATDFTQIVIDHASSTFNLTNATISALGTHNPGQLVFNNASTSAALDTCVFAGLGISTLRAGVAATSCTWRAAGAITSNGATLDACLITNSPAAAAVIGDDLDDYTDCTFESDGSGHAIDLGTIAADATMGWDNYDSGYAATDGSTGDETIKTSVDSGKTLTINVGSGYTTPTIYNAGAGTVTVVSGQVTTTIKVVDVTDGSVIQGARVYLLADTGGPLAVDTEIFNELTDVDGEVSDTRSLGSSQPVVGRVRKGSAATLYKTSPIAGTIDNGSGLTLTVQLIPDE